MNILRRGKGRTLIPSAIESRGIGELAHMGYVAEAVVIATYFPEDEDREWAAGDQRCITCDVQTLGQKNRFLPRVPVYQYRHGIWDEDIWTPRPTRQDVSGGALSAEQDGITKPTPLDSMDGDHVLVGFRDGSIHKPFIYPFQAPHPHAQYLPSAHVRRIRHNGVLVEWDEDGNWTLDATGAAKTILGAKGSEVSNSGIGGQITIKTKDGAAAESSIKLDNTGGIKILDAGGNYVELTKSGVVTLNAIATKNLVAGTTLNATAPTTNITAGVALNATSPAVTVTSASIVLGAASPLTLPLIKHTLWAAAWTTLQGIANDQAGSSPPGTYHPGASPPATEVAPIDYYNLVNAINALCALFPTLATTTTRAL